MWGGKYDSGNEVERGVTNPPQENYYNIYGDGVYNYNKTTESLVSIQNEISEHLGLLSNIYLFQIFKGGIEIKKLCCLQIWRTVIV